MRKFAMMLALLIFTGVQVVLAQTTITGTVTSSEDSKGIPGATVVVKGTNVGLTTDMSGKYSIKVPANGKILTVFVCGNENSGNYCWQSDSYQCCTRTRRNEH
ncbi:MAG: carboxypeptidase-like regulatory domain-containing protein [Bacteroidales bacterium]|nr:carboxypeptidase-like regulatory domain-containing protein [Bacteroidales bacterium]